MQTSTRSTRSKMALVANHELQHQRLMADIGPHIRAGAVANRLGISVPMVEQLRLSNRILAVPHDHGYIYPCWQFEARSMLSGLMPVLTALAAYDAWTQVAFLVTPNRHLVNQRPLDTLRHGEVEAVLMAARRLCERPATDDQPPEMTNNQQRLFLSPGAAAVSIVSERSVKWDSSVPS